MTGVPADGRNPVRWPRQRTLAASRSSQRCQNHMPDKHRTAGCYRKIERKEKSRVGKMKDNAVFRICDILKPVLVVMVSGLRPMRTEAPHATRPDIEFVKRVRTSFRPSQRRQKMRVVEEFRSRCVEASGVCDHRFSVGIVGVHQHDCLKPFRHRCFETLRTVRRFKTMNWPQLRRTNHS